MADAKAFTSTPDVAAGNPVDVTTVTTAAGAVDRQRVSIGDPLGLNPDLRPDGSGNLPISGVVGLSPTSPPATGLADTLFASGDVAGPAGGTAIATLTTPAAGTYRLDLTCFTYVANLTAGVAPDMELRKGAAVQISKLGGLSAAKDGTVTPGVAGMPTVLENIRMTLDGATNVSINATTGLAANYVAQLLATRMA